MLMFNDRGNHQGSENYIWNYISPKVSQVTKSRCSKYFEVRNFPDQITTTIMIVIKWSFLIPEYEVHHQECSLVNAEVKSPYAMNSVLTPISFFTAIVWHFHFGYKIQAVFQVLHLQFHFSIYSRSFAVSEASCLFSCFIPCTSFCMSSTAI